MKPLTLLFGDKKWVKRVTIVRHKHLFPPNVSDDSRRPSPLLVYSPPKQDSELQLNPEAAVVCG